MYVNEFIVTRKLYREWMRATAKKPVQMLFRVIWLVLAASMILYAVAYRYIYVVHLLLIVFCLYNAFFMWRVQAYAVYRKLSKVQGKNWKRQIFFGDNIRVMDGRLTTDYDYDEIAEVKGKGNLVELISRNKLKLRIYKDCFTVGSWEECSAHIERKRKGIVGVVTNPQKKND